MSEYGSAISKKIAIIPYALDITWIKKLSDLLNNLSFIVSKDFFFTLFCCVRSSKMILHCYNNFHDGLIILNFDAFLIPI